MECPLLGHPLLVCTHNIIHKRENLRRSYEKLDKKMDRLVYKKDSIHPLSWELEEIKTALGINFTWIWERLGLTWKLGLHDISFANGRTWVDMKTWQEWAGLCTQKSRPIACLERKGGTEWPIEAFHLWALIGVPWKLELLYRTWWAPVLLSLVEQIWIWSSVAGSLAENVLLRLNMHWVDQLSGDAADVHFIFQTNSAPVEIFGIELGKISLCGWMIHMKWRT